MSDARIVPKWAPVLVSDGATVVPIEWHEIERWLVLPERLWLGQLAFTRKRELHMTIVNTAQGKALGELRVRSPEVWEAMERVLAVHALTLTVGEELVHVAKPAGSGEKALQTIVVRVVSDLAGLYAKWWACGEEVVHALREVPPPHVTLYTSDESGAAGIGLHSEAMLEDALARGAGRLAGEGRVAWRLCPAVISRKAGA